MTKKRKVNKSPIIIIILLVLIAIVGYVICLLSFEFELTDKKDSYEINYNDKNIEETSMKCTFFGKKVKNIKKDKEIDNTKLGDVEITYTCSKLLISKKLKVKYTIIDKEAPKIELKGKKINVIYTGEEYSEEGYNALDNSDGDITEKVTIDKKYDNSKVGTYYITYKVTDNSGNSAEEKREILVRKKSSSSLDCGEPGTIYLTFDDGPNNTTTTQILDVLKKYNVKATFFVTNTNGGDDSQIKREFDEGHKVAIHTNSHDYSIVYSSYDNFWKDMNAIGERIERITGEKTDVLRFPGGSSNTVSRRYSSGIMTTLTKDVEEKGFNYVDWNVDSRDAEPAVTKTSDDVYKNVTSQLGKGRGNIILMHDIKKTTAGAIERIIQYGQNNGYKFDVLTRETSICHHRVVN